MKEKKITGTDEAWENGTLGRDEAFAARAPLELTQQVDDALGLQMISIRLPKELIQDFKMIADVNGMGYQPLMREALKRFADAELKLMAIQFANEKVAAREKMKIDSTPAPESTTSTLVATPRKRQEKKVA